MPRIRTVKPEFWEDEVVGLLPRDARLLFIATFNMADDEGLLRWTPAYIKASAFMYDDDLTIPEVAKLMTAVTDAGLLFPFIGGVARQQMAVVVNFRKHQRVNRPQRSKLPPPSLQSDAVRRMYARRDLWTCALCGGGIPENPVKNDAHNLSIDHIKPQSGGGTDHPSNVRATHRACGQSRHDGRDEEFIPPSSMAGLNDSLRDSVNRSVNGAVNRVNQTGDTQRDDTPGTTVTPYTESEIHSLNDSLNGSVNGSLTNSLPEGKGKEGNREGKGTPLPPTHDRSGPPAAIAPEKGLPSQMLDAWWEKYGKRTAQGKRSVRTAIADALGNGLDPHELWAALERLGEVSKPITGGTLQFALAEVRKPSNVIALPTGQALTGTDARVAAHAALTEQLRAMEARESS